MAIAKPEFNALQLGDTIIDDGGGEWKVLGGSRGSSTAVPVTLQSPEGVVDLYSFGSSGIFESETCTRVPGLNDPNARIVKATAKAA